MIPGLLSIWAAATVMAAPVGRADIPPGVVVEAVQRGFTADLGGVRTEDVLVAWSQADGAGGERRHELSSPFLQADLEYGQLTRGPVVLHGTRAGVPLRVEVAADAVGLGVTLRPRLPPAFLDLYVRGRKQIDAGRVQEGTSLWREAAVRARTVEGGTTASCWLLAQTGTAWAVAKAAEPAREAFYDAAACAEDVDDRAVATILEWQAEHEVELGAPEARAAALEMACALREAHPGSFPLSAVECLFNLASTWGQLGRGREARQLGLFLLELAEREAPDSLLVSRLLQRTGVRDGSAGNLEAAEAAYRRATDIAQRAGPWSSTWARAQTGLGTLAGTRGDLATQEHLLRQAMEHFMRYSPDSLDAARALLNVGHAAHQRGDLTAARHWGQEALRVLEALPTGRSIRGAVLSNLAEAALLEGDLDGALRLYERAADDIRATSPVSRLVIDVELGLSAALSARGDLPGAQLHAEAALEHAELHAPRAPVMAHALVVRGELASRQEDWETAEECFAAAIETLDQLQIEGVVRTQALAGLASVLRFRGDDLGAERHLRQALVQLNATRGRVGRSDEERSLFTTRFHGIYRDLIDLLAQQGRMVEAFDVLEASRARALLSMLAARDLLFDLDVPADKERERRAVDAAYERAKERLAKLPQGADAAQRATMEAQLIELRERQRQIEAEVRAASPRLAALREPQPLDAAGVGAHLDPGTLLIAYSVGAKRTVAFTVGGADGLQGHLIPAGADELRSRIQSWRKLALASPPGPGFRPEARSLYALLLGPLAQRVRRADRLVISADGPLHELPFAALRDERGYLAERVALAFVPSGTLYTQQAAARGPRRWGPPAAFGDPLYGAGGFAPLPGSRREVSTVAAVFPTARTYLGAQATEDTVKALDRDGRFVHFAVHGLVDVRAPLDSALALSTKDGPAGNGDNGLLYAWEIFERVRLDADLVALSACGSAAGADRPGEGIIGLTRAFVYAGARSVLASLWNVGDASTGPFMRAFYEAWAGGATKADALRRAQVAAIRRGQRPLRWAGFQLYGDDR